MRRFEKISQKQWIQDAHSLDYHDIILPRRATRQSAGYDLFSPQDIELEPGSTIIIPTGVKVYMNPDEVLLINSRSGHGYKFGVRLCNVQGWIDADYVDNETNEGHIMLCLVNDGVKTFRIEKHHAIAQALFTHYLITEDDIPMRDKRRGGLGSTK